MLKTDKRKSVVLRIDARQGSWLGRDGASWVDGA